MEQQHLALLFDTFTDRVGDRKPVFKYKQGLPKSCRYFWAALACWAESDSLAESCRLGFVKIAAVKAKQKLKRGRFQKNVDFRLTFPYQKENSKAFLCFSFFQ